MTQPTSAKTAPKPGFLKKRVLDWLGVEAEAPADSHKNMRFAEAAGVTIDADEDNWRPLTGDVQRDLSPMTQQRMQKMALYLWEANLLANRLIELPVAYILGEGVTVTVGDKDAQQAIDAFWNDPINQMDLKLPKKVRELAIYGEQAWPTFVNDKNGRVRLGYLDPAQIETVVKDPDNGEQPIGIVTVKNNKGQARRYKVAVNGEEAEIFTARTRAIREKFDDGEILFFCINDLSNGRRGRSDLLAQTDWLDTYEQFMFGEADRALALRSFIWDVTLKGASAEQVKARSKELTAPRPGSVRVHNDSEEWSAEAPTLGANDLSEVAKLFRNHIVGGATIPTTWYGGSQDANRAVGQEMAEPTVKVLAQRQNTWKHILKFVAQYVIRQKWLIERKGEPDWTEEDLQVSVEFPEIQSRDVTKYAAAMQQVTAAVVIAIDKGLMTEQLGLSLIEKIAERLGVEFDAAEELEKAREEKKKRDAERMDNETFGELPGEGDDPKPPATPPKPNDPSVQP